MHKFLFFLALGLIIMSFLPFWSDPYDHSLAVDFWGWSKRELIEVVSGEK